MKNKQTFLAIIIGEVVAFVIFSFTNIPCFFKLTIHIPCPGCGLTRALKEILKLHFIEAFNYNILSIPIFILLIIINITMIIDIIKNTKITNKTISNIVKHPIILIVLLVLSEVVNLYNGR